jgi:citronellol/citronellal dehydrogenase
MRFQGKVAIVTGASRGIGAAEAIAFAKEGAAVVVAARTVQERDPRLPGTVHSVVEEIRKAGGRAIAVKCDVSNEDEVRAMVDAALSEFGRIDVLVNNAAILFPHELLDMPAKRWRVTIEVNTTGSFLCTKHVAPAMIRQGGGSIVNTTTGTYFLRSENPSGFAYGVAKVGVEQLTYASAAQLAKHDIAVNCLHPAKGVLTPGATFGVPDIDKSDWIGPELMVKACLFLAQQRASGVTGTVRSDADYIRYHRL